MPIVNIKGVGEAQFPDNMSREEIAGFLRNKYPSQQAMQSRVSLEPKPQTIEPYTPTLAQGMGQNVSDFLYENGFTSSPYRAQEIGRNLTSIGEFLPVIGDATAGDEFGRAVKEGDKFGMAMAGLGAIPVVGDVAGKGLSKARKLVDNLDIEYKSIFAPLQAEYRAGVTQERKVEILKEAKRLRAPLDAAKSSLFRAEQAAKPKVEKVLVKEEPNKTFKGKVFHQTAEDFNDFDFNKSADGTIWFTGDKKNFSDPSSSASAASGKAKILERNVELNKVAGFDELDKYSIGELRQQGYDGAVLDGDIQVFDPKAIKRSIAPKKPVQSLPVEGVKFKSDSTKDTEYLIGNDGSVHLYLAGREEWKDVTGTLMDKNIKKKYKDISDAGGLEKFEAASKERIAKMDADHAATRKLAAQQQEDTYKMQHTAPLRDDNPSGHDVSDSFGNDIYTGNALQYFGTGATFDQKAINIIQGMKNKPQKPVTIYRAVPKDVKEINAKDWVTTTREYAKQHMEGEKGWHIISKKVKAKEIATDGNSIHEFGYDPD